MTELVGRDPVLAELGAWLDAALGGRGGLVVISGEPGIGKSALCDVLVERARAGGAHASYGRSWEYADAPPYFPVRGTLRELGIDTDAERDPFALWERVLERLAQAAAVAPQVWIVEDAHAADLGTLDLLAFLARPVRSLAVALVVTRRDRDARLAEASEHRLARLAREGHAIALGPLAPDSVAELAQRAAGRALAPAARARLVELTGGNPLFAIECARALRRDGAATLPETLRLVVLERVAALGDTTRATLAAAAVLGRETSALAIARVVDQLPARVIERLAPAVRAGVLVETAPGDYAFSHVIVRDVVEDAIPSAERAELHRTAADALARVAGPAALVERARHALAAVAAAAVPDVAAIVGAAIDHLVERNANDRAFALARELERVRAAAGLTPATLDERLRLAHLAFAAGRSRDAHALCEELLADARRAGDAVGMARAALALGSEIRASVVDRQLIAALEEALAALRDREPALRCRLDARLAAARQPALDFMQPIALAESAIAAARALGDRTLLCEVIDIGGAALVDIAPLERRLAASSELIELARELGDRPRELRGRMRRALELVERGDFAGFGVELEALLALSRELGEPRYRWRPLLMSSLHALAEGRTIDSERALVEAEQLQAVLDEPALRRSIYAHAGTRAVQLYHDEQLRALVGEVEELAVSGTGKSVIAAAIRADVFATIGDPERVRTELGRVGPAFEHLARHTYARNLLVVPCVLVGSEAQRRLLYEVFASLGDSDLVSGHVALTYDGPRARMLGLLAASLGDRPTGEAKLREALALARSRGHRLWVARIAYELGALVDDRALLGEAAALAAEIGMPGLVARIAHHGVGEAARAVPPRLHLAREGDVWRVSVGDRIVRVKDSRGMQLLARLVERPSDEIHVLALASDDPASALHDRGEPALDERARRDYRRRLSELADELAAAEACGDERRATALERERDQLAAELARASGLGGKPRRAGAISERARSNVQRRLKDAIGRIAELDPALGRYLEQAIRTGTYCCFRP